MLEIKCSECNGFVCDYQKDGPGPLKRMYKDRVLSKDNITQEYGERLSLICPCCKKELGFSFQYTNHGENRTAFRLYVGAVKKHFLYKG